MNAEEMRIAINRIYNELGALRASLDSHMWSKRMTRNDSKKVGDAMTGILEIKNKVYLLMNPQPMEKGSQ